MALSTSVVRKDVIQITKQKLAEIFERELENLRMENLLRSSFDPAWVAIETIRKSYERIVDELKDEAAATEE